jgi:hypothetical protein
MGQDLNGDGRAEYPWVDANGAVTAYLNLGPTSDQESFTGATVQWLPQGVIATGIGAKRQEVQFAVRCYPLPFFIKHRLIMLVSRI